MTSDPEAEVAAVSMTGRIALAVLLAMTLLRATMALGMDLMPQDTYYFLYAENLALSYPDHPPLIGYLLWLSSTIFGKTELSIRVVTLGTTLATQLVVWRLATVLFGREAGSRAAVLFSLMPLTTVLSLVTTPEVPLLLAWGITLLGFEAALFRHRVSGWLLAAVGMGLALLSKYTALFLPAGLLLFLVSGSPNRRVLLSPAPWLAIALSFTMALPSYLGSLSNGGGSFGFQIRERIASLAPPDPGDLLGFFLVQGISFLPVTLVLLLMASARGLWLPSLRTLDDRSRFVWCFAAPLLLTASALSPFLWVKLNWPMAAAIGGVMMVLPRLSARRVFVSTVAVAILVHMLLTIMALAYPVPVSSNDTWFGWREVSRAAEQQWLASPERFVFSTDGYKTAAELRFYSDLPEVFGLDIVGCPALQLGVANGDPIRLQGRDGLLVVSEPELRPSHRTDVVLRRAAHFFDEIRERPSVVIENRGRVARLVRFFEADGYKGPDATREADHGRLTETCSFRPSS